MINKKLIPYGRQDINEDDIEAVVASLKSDFLTQGPKIQEFEERFAEYIGSSYAVAVSNGTAALHLSVLALGLSKGQKVITTPITFAASSNCILYAGAEVSFVDIDEDTGVIDLKKVRELLASSPKGTYAGMIPVDFSGYPVDMEETRKIANEFGLWIVEDACHAPGGYFFDSKGVKQKCGNGVYSDLAIFSFHPVKHIATGEGGMVTTNSKELYEKLKLLRTHGITKDLSSFELSAKDIDQGGWYYEMQDLGYNYRIPDILASLGVSQLKRAEKSLHRRREIAKKYDLAFKNTKIQPLSNTGKMEGHAYHLYVIKTEYRLELYNYLKENQIFAQVHYIPVHLLPYYQKLGFKKGMFPIAEQYYHKALSIPMFPTLTDIEQDYVIEKVLSL